MYSYLKVRWGLMMIVVAMTFTACSGDETSKNTHSNKSDTGVQVPDGFSVQKVADANLVKFPMFGSLDENGRLFLFESVGHVYKNLFQDAIDNPQYRVNMLEDVDDDGVYDKSTIYADSLSFPQGGVFYKGSLIVCSAPDLLKLTDTDGDGVADKREVLLTGWKFSAGANSLVGPFLGPDGWLYMTSAIMGFDITNQEGKHLKGETSRIWRVRPDGSGLESMAGGSMNNPVELTFTEASEPIGTETYFTDPKAGLRDALVYWTEGGTYPKPHEKTQNDKLIRTGELMPVVTQYSRVSPAGIGRYRNTILGDGFKDNLFSAHFNTHNVLRHKLFRKDAFFYTEDEPFFWSDDKDFHPTDVMEDADGSLLIVETGGWFTWGCPLSQVAKPELEGAIYRVRRDGASSVEDPYGKRIAWNNLDVPAVARLLEDKRPFVNDRAIQWLVDKGDAGIAAVGNMLKKSKSEDARTKAVFTLLRVGTQAALAFLPAALDDNSEQVRNAAARAAGLAKDNRLVNKLMELVQHDKAPAVRRQAATALGQIGDERAVPALLAAADGTKERFIEHAIIYALITLNRPSLVEQGLSHKSGDVNEAALIALDQMPGSPLRANQLIPFLTSSDKNLQHTALWISSHHPEWAKDMMAFLSNRFQQGTLSDDEKKLLGDMLISFCGDKDMQEFMASQMKQAPAERKVFLLDAMGACSVEKFPAFWVREVEQELLSKDETVKTRAIDLVRMRGIKPLAPILQQIVSNEQQPASLRIDALGALLELNPKVNDRQFSFLLSQLDSSSPMPLRMRAASVFTRGELSEPQLIRLLNYLPSDNDMLPRLAPVFAGSTSEQVGKPLASLLMNLPSLDNFTEENVRTLFSTYPKEMMPLVEQLIEKLKKERAGRLQRLEELESQIETGNMMRGRQLFFGKATCFACHTIGPEGGTLGPDLTSISQTRSAHDLLEAIVYPAVSIVREFETYQIKTKTNNYTGIIQQQGPDAIVLRTSPDATVRIPREEIISSEIVDASMMPPGLDKLLNAQEMADLMAFLIGQDQDPKKDESLLR